ncbi:hypothetical protein ACVWXN_000185 [Bradyrhizobium sp. i1.4.4]
MSHVLSHVPELAFILMNSRPLMTAGVTVRNPKRLFHDCALQKSCERNLKGTHKAHSVPRGRTGGQFAVLEMQKRIPEFPCAAGLRAGLGLLAIPGLGPVVAAGWLASRQLALRAAPQLTALLARSPKPMCPRKTRRAMPNAVIVAERWYRRG